MSTVSTDSAKHDTPSGSNIGSSPEGMPTGLNNGALNQKLGHHSWGKLIFLGALSVVLSSFTPFFLLAPAPLAFAFLLFGPLRTVAVALFFTVLIFALVFKTGLSLVSGGVFLLALAYAAIVYIIIKRKMNPVTGLMRYGFGIVGLAATTIGVGVWSAGISLKPYLLQVVTTGINEIKSNAEYGQLVSKGGEDIRALQDMMQDPNGIVQELLQWSPSALFVMVILTLWISLFVVLRNSSVWSSNRPYPFDVNTLINFKAPDFLLYGLIAGLAFAAGGDLIAGEWLQIVGMNILYAVGVFYFFQGVGVFLELLNSLKILGLFRSIIVVFTIFSAWKMVALIGLFDNWFNFRKFFKKNNEGDIV